MKKSQSHCLNDQIAAKEKELTKKGFMSNVFILRWQRLCAGNISGRKVRTMEKLLEEIGRHTVPVRPDRQNKRDLKAKGFVGFTYQVSS